MTFKYFVKSMMSGMVFPGIFLPLAYTSLYFYESTLIQTNPLQFIPMYIPILFGVTNVIYLWIGDRCPIQDINWRLWVTGASLGLIVALFGVFVFNVPTLIFGLSYGFEYMPLVFLPIIYSVIFRYIIKWLNNILDI